MDTYEKGAKAGSFGCRPGGYYSADTLPATCVTGTVLDTLPIPPGNSAYSDTATGLHKKYSGFRSRFNLSWKPTEDTLLYYTWSQGFRPGGFNRASGFVAPNTSPLAGTFLTPIGFKPDTLINNEVGWKTQWLNHRLQFNGAVYQEDWKDVQISLFDPGLLGNLTFATNGPEYHVTGAEAELTAKVTRGLTVSASGSWNHSELYKEVALYDKNGNPIDLAALGLRNPFGVKGDPLAQSPSFQGSMRVRYDFAFNDFAAFWQLAGTRRSDSYSTTDRLTNDLNGNSIAYRQPGYSSLDGSVGLSKGEWALQLYGSNLTDTRGIVYSSYSQWIKMDTVTRPRTIGLRVSYKLGGI
jgi:outer membrane receptor protein involved in Fe transport